jgi:hypothetical protein
MKLNTFVSATLLLGLAATSTGCSDEEVAVGVGVGAVVGGAALIGSGLNRDDDYYRGHRTTRRCYSYHDNWGNLREECYNRRVGRGYGRWYDYLSANSVAGFTTNSFVNDNGMGDLGMAPGILSLQDVAAAADIDPGDWGAEFKMSIGQSAKFIGAMKQAAQGQTAPIFALGFNKSDLDLLGQFKLPTKQGIKNLSVNIEQSEIATTGMLNRLRAKAIREKNDRCNGGAGHLEGSERGICSVR